MLYLHQVKHIKASVIILQAYKVKAYDMSNYGLKKISTSSGKEQKAVVILHGINQTRDDLEDPGYELNALSKNLDIWVFGYNYHNSFNR